MPLMEEIITRAELIIDQIESQDLTTIQLLEFDYRKARYSIN